MPQIEYNGSSTLCPRKINYFCLTINTREKLIILYLDDKNQNIKYTFKYINATNMEPRLGLD